MSDIDIESAANPRIKAAVALRQRRDRERTGLTIIDGARELTRAIEAEVTIEEAFVCPPLVRTDEAAAVIDALRARSAPLVTVSEVAYRRLAYGDRSDGVVAVVCAPDTDLGRLAVPEEPLIVVLEGIEKPGNLGAVLRSADGAGIDAVLLADPATDVFNPNTIRASLGTVFTLPIGAGDTPNVRTWLGTQNVRLVAARVDGDRAPWDVDLTGAVAIVLGSEAEGLGARWAGDDLVPVRIPMRGLADSLNVSVAAAVLLYEARRQRG